MRLLHLTIIFLWLTACETKTVKFSGLNDLFVGVNQIVLYDNGEFYLELGAGGKEGTYEIHSDTIDLDYAYKQENWPDQILMTEKFFQTIPTDEHTRTIKIHRATEEK
jgi:hypothetical protein